MPSTSSNPKRQKLDVPPFSSLQQTSSSHIPIPLSTENPSSSSLVLEALSSLPLATFRQLLSSFVLPTIDALPKPQSGELQKAFTAALEFESSKQDRLDRLAFHQHAESLKRALAKLEKAAKRNPRGDSHQETLVERLAEEMQQWSQDLFRVCIELGSELELGFKAACILDDTVGDLNALDSLECPFRDEYEKFTVTASNGEVAWSAGNFDLLLAKLFRELALVASSKGEEALVVAILDHVLKDQSSELYEMFTGLLRPEGVDAAKGPRGYQYDDAWYPAELKASLPKLKQALHFSHLSFYQSHPDRSLYRPLIAHDPSLAPTLLSIAQTKLALLPPSSLSRGLVDLAFDLYFKSNDLPSVVSLLDTLQHLSDDQNKLNLTTTNLLTLAKHSPNGLSLATPLLQHNLKKARLDIWSRMDDYLPGLDGALSSLEEDCSDLGIPMARTAGETEGVTKKRRELVAVCLRAAAQSDDSSDDDEEEEPGFGWGPEDFRRADSSSGSGTDSDGQRYKEKKRRKEPHPERDLGNILERWVDVLAEWPDDASRLSIEAQLNPGKFISRPFYQVEGLPKLLAQKISSFRRRDYMFDPLALSIMALYASNVPRRKGDETRSRRVIW